MGHYVPTGFGKELGLFPLVLILESCDFFGGVATVKGVAGIRRQKEVKEEETKQLF